MRSLLCMEVLDATQQLHKAAAGVSFIVASSLQQRVQQLSSCEQLCDEVHLPGVQTPSMSLLHAARSVMPAFLILPHEALSSSEVPLCSIRHSSYTPVSSPMMTDACQACACAICSSP